MKAFTYSNTVLSITILLLIRNCPLNVITLDFSGHISIQNGFVMLCEVNDALCESSETDRSIWSSASNNV
jgi:hypothetical protein